MEPGWTQEGQRAKEDREPTALVPGVQVSAGRVLGLLWQGKQPCTRPPSVQGKGKVSCSGDLRTPAYQ